jgi:hypothetical protein
LENIAKFADGGIFRPRARALAFVWNDSRDIFSPDGLAFDVGRAFGNRPPVGPGIFRLARSFG